MWGTRAVTAHGDRWPAGGAGGPGLSQCMGTNGRLGRGWGTRAVRSAVGGVGGQARLGWCVPWVLREAVPRVSLS